MTTSTAVQAAPAATVWALDPAHTQVEFAVRHLMISTVRGRFSGAQGTLAVPEGDFSRAELKASIGVASLDTREAQRDAHLRSADFFDAETIPTIEFQSRRVEADPRDSDKLLLVGDLTLRGITREITLTVNVEGRGRDPWGGERIGFSAAGRISRKDFGLTWNQLLETGGVAVGDEVKISIDTEFVAQAAAAA